MAKKPTIKTIAQMADVSYVAVSRALRGCSDISPATTQRILDIANEIGYTPNAYARGLSSRRTNTLGMIVPAMGENTAYNEVFTTVSTLAAQKGYCVMLGCTDRDIELEKKYCRMMSEHQIGVLIIASTTSEVSHIKEICHDIPVIFIGGKTGPEQEYSLMNDYHTSARLVVEHLTGLGHTDIALFVYEPDNLTIRQKKEGFIAEMKKRGLEAHVYQEGHSADTLAAGRTLTRRLIQTDALPTAIWCASDLMAMGVLAALKEAGISVPGDISVVGHDNLYFSSFPGTGLTTLDTPKTELGIHAVELAIALIEDAKEKPAAHQVFKTQLVVRESTDVPPKIRRKRTNTHNI